LKPQKKLNPNAKFAALVQNPNTYPWQGQLKLYDRWNLSEVFRAILETDTVLFGGGGLFQDTTSLRSLLYYCMIILGAWLLGRPIKVLGIGIGPLKGKLSKGLIRMLFKKMDLVVLRDSESKHHIEGVKLSSPLKILTDTTLLHKFPGPNREKKQTLKRVAWIIRDFPNSKIRESLMQSVAEGILTLTYRWNIVPLIWAFQGRSDRRFVDQLKKRLTKSGYKRIDTNFYEGTNLTDTLKSLSKMDFIFSARYHGVVSAVHMGVPVAGYDVDPKIVQFLKEVTPQEYQSKNVIQWGTLPSKNQDWTQYDQLWRDRQILSKKLRENIYAIRKKVHNEWEESMKNL